MLERQTCKVCGKIDKFNFSIPDEIWNKIVPEDKQNHVVCLSCFDEFANEKGIDYAEYIDILYFVGKRGVFTFSTLSRSN